MPQAGVAAGARRTRPVELWGEMPYSALDAVRESPDETERVSIPMPPEEGSGVAPAPRPWRAGEGVPGRRTVTISGRQADRYAPRSGARRLNGDDPYAPRHTQPARRRAPTRAHERAGFRPDRVAMWAVMLGLLLVFVAATSSHAAVRTHRAAAASSVPHALTASPHHFARR